MKTRILSLPVRLSALVGALLLTAASGCPAPAAPDAGVVDGGPAPGEDQVVTLFDLEDIYFAAGDDRREREAAVVFPPARETFSAIRLDIALTCPQGGCDFYDRIGTLSVDNDAGESIEFARFITPFGQGANYSLDVTPLRPLFTSHDGAPKVIKALIDTYVGPGSGFGAGWVVTATLAFTGGVPERTAVEVVPLWPRQRVVVGDPARPAATTLGAAEIPLEGAHDVEVWTVVSGHGQGNANNCAEFCTSFHAVTVRGSEGGSDLFTREVWRDDCEESAPGPQPGTWTLSRAGWCPGLEVLPWIERTRVNGDVSATWDPGPYINTCRPDAQTCAGCTLQTGCEYDGGAHTEPGFELSGLMIIYE